MGSMYFCSVILLLCVQGEARHCAFVPSPSSTSVDSYLQPRTPRISLRASENNEDESESVNMEELQKRIDKQLNQYYELLQSDTEDARPETVHIIVFNPESEEEQGVHTIEFPKGSGNNIILAFESGVECVEFAEGLKNMQFYDPVPQETDLEQLEEFCQVLGIPVKVVPAGKSLTPPSENVDEMAFNPNIGKEKSMLEDLVARSEDDDNEGNGSWE